MEQVRVVVAEDHDVMRGLICTILDANPSIEVIDEAANGVEALDKVRTHSPDVLILDLQMPLLSGVGVLKSVYEEKLPVKVLVLSGYVDPYIVRGVFEYGVAGYVTKEDVHDELVEAVIIVANNKKVYVSNKAEEVLKQ
jgi:two-component system nitrate/nitrite response regulator NarL